MKLKSEISELKVEQRRPTQEMIRNAQLVFNRPEDEEPLFHPFERIFLGRAQSLADPILPDTFSIPVQTFKIGELGIAAAPFEVFAQSGLEIKSRSPFEATFTIELANGSFGYLPTSDQFELGGYETWIGSNIVGENTANELVNRITNQFQILKE